MLDIQPEESEEAQTSAEVLDGVTGWHLVSPGSQVWLNFSHRHILCCGVLSQLLSPFHTQAGACMRRSAASQGHTALVGCETVVDW